jgi:uncharacterized protein YuzE
MAGILESTSAQLWLDTKLNITYDPDANAIYVRISEFQDVGKGETKIDDFGVIIDTDADGNPRGYELLAVREKGVPLVSLPTSVARALNDFISSGALASEVPVQRDYDT